MGGLQHTGAFVVQFTLHDEITLERLDGRIEHVASGESARFTSAGELFTFVARVLRQVTLESGRDDRRRSAPITKERP